MRLLGLSLLLPLAACFSPHGMAASATDGTSTGNAITTSTGTSTGEPSPTTTTATTHSGSVTSDTLTTTTDVTTSTDPLTSTTDVTTTGLPSTSEPASTTTTGPPSDLPDPVCNFVMAGDQTRQVLQLQLGDAPIKICDSPTTWIGSVKMDKSKLTLTINPACTMGVVMPDLAIGPNWPSSFDRDYACAKVTVYWAKVDDSCQIGALEIVEHDPNNNPVDPDLLIAASLSYPEKPAEFRLWPPRNIMTPCGCKGEMPCCTPDDAGEYTLQVTNSEVITGTSQTVIFDEMQYYFANIQSYVGVGCKDDPPTDRHFDWFIEKK